ncbi:putative cysteine desulfurase [compost metagenome]
MRPDRYEAGTQNTPGLAGLSAGVQYVLKETVPRIYEKEWLLTQRLMQGLQEIAGVSLLGPKLGEPRTGIVAFNVENIDPSELSFILDQHYQIAVRAGFHCTPLAHMCAGTSATGAVRASVGLFTTEDEVDALTEAIKEITLQYQS